MRGLLVAALAASAMAANLPRPAKELVVRTPKHPYTQLLIASVPQVSTERSWLDEQQVHVPEIRIDVIGVLRPAAGRVGILLSSWRPPANIVCNAFQISTVTISRALPKGQSWKP